MANGAPSFLGKGWHFPPTFTASGRDVWRVADEEDIQQSLYILLSTAQGERVMREDFGASLNPFMFEEMDGSLRNSVTVYIRKALLRHEPRISVEKVDVTASNDAEGVLLIHLTYRVLATNSRFNLVYPFYLNETAQGRP